MNGKLSEQPPAELIREISLKGLSGTLRLQQQRAEPDLRALMMEAARRAQPKFVSSRFRNPNELISPVAGLPNNISLSPTEGFVLSRVDIPTKLNELIAISGLSDLEAYRAIYVLALGGFLHR